jgi:hypothetical protein
MTGNNAIHKAVSVFYVWFHYWDISTVSHYFLNNSFSLKVYEKLSAYVILQLIVLRLCMRVCTHITSRQWLISDRLLSTVVNKGQWTYIIMAAVWGDKLIRAIMYLPDTSRFYLSGASEWQSIYTAKHVEKEEICMIWIRKNVSSFVRKTNIKIHFILYACYRGFEKKILRLNLGSMFACTI